jgi:phosphoglycolate phosphatase-like HAD superfamily hydrolase
MTRSIVMFDMDGTLSDTMPQLVDFLVSFARDELGADEEMLRREIPAVFHLAPSQMAPAFLTIVGRDPETMPQEEIDAILGKYFATLRDLPTVLFPESAAVLASLKAAGYTLVFSSTTHESEVDSRLESAGIRTFFDLVLGVDLVQGRTKAGHPERAKEALGLSATAFSEASVYVGDTPGDMEVATDAGMVAIGRLTADNEASLRAAGAHYVIHDLTELQPLLLAID